MYIFINVYSKQYAMNVHMYVCILHTISQHFLFLIIYNNVKRSVLHHRM